MPCVFDMEVAILTDSNFMQYAMGTYTNPSCIGMREFVEDLSRIKYIKRLLRRYKKTGEIRDQLLTNHFIVLSNVFGITGAARLLFFKVEPELHPEIKTFMVHIGTLPRQIPEADLIQIPLNREIVDILRSSRST
jgi:hypothetical protein